MLIFISFVLQCDLSIIVYINIMLHGHILFAVYQDLIHVSNTKRVCN